MAVKKIRKQVLKKGKWFYEGAPNGVLNFTKEYLTQLADNFKKTPFVPVLRSHVENKKAEQDTKLIIAKNIEALEFEDDGLYAYFSIDEKELEKYNDVSVGIEPGEDHKSGQFIGDVVKHIAMVLNPYIKDLNTFQSLTEKPQYFIKLSEITMEDETKAEVTETKEEVTTKETETKETTETETTITETAETKTEEKVTEIVADETEDEKAKSSDEIRTELSEKEEENKRLRKQLSNMQSEQAFNGLLGQGKVLPAFKPEFLALSEVLSESSKTIELTEGDKKVSKPVLVLLTDLFNKLPVLVNLTEKGINTETGEKSAIQGISVELTETMRESFKRQNPNGTEEEFIKFMNDKKEIIMKHDKPTK